MLLSPFSNILVLLLFQLSLCFVCFSLAIRRFIRCKISLQCKKAYSKLGLGFGSRILLANVISK